MKTMHGPKRRRSRISAQLLVVAVIAAMLFSVLPLGGGASAEDNPVIDPNISTTVTDTVDDPVVDPPPTETLTPEPTSDDPTLLDDVTVDDIDDVVVETVEPTYGDVTVNKITCPAGFNALTASIYDLAANCHDQQAATFTLTDVNGGSSSLTTPGSGLNSVTFSSVPTGQLTISEQIPAGFTSPRVFCKNSAYTGEETAEIEQGISNGTVYTELMAGYDFVYCDWFNIPEPQYGDVIINKIGCPMGYDAYSGSIYDLAANCHEQPVSTFHLFDANGAQQDATTPGSGVNSVTFSNVPGGAIAVTEDQMNGYGAPRVFCKNSAYAGGDTAEDEVMVDNYGINYELMAGYDFVWCDWFNIPTDTNGTIEIHKWECPQAWSSDSNDWNDYLSSCSQVMNGVPFHAAINGSDLPTKMTGDDGDGTVTWSDVEAGDLVIQEEIPSGYGDPVVFCGFTYTTYTNDVPAIADGKIFPDTVHSGVLEHEFAQGESLYCDWFNMPTDTYGSITIYKHTCQAGYDVNAYGSNPWLDCSDLTNGITFKVYQGGSFYSQSDTGDSIDGAVYWGGLQADDYQIQETMPADTAYAFIYGCMSDSYESLAPTDLISLDADNSFDVDLQQGEHLTCHWYNVPVRHGGTIVITKYWCDGAVYNTYACDLYEQGASFRIADQWSSFKVTTGQDGTVSADVDAGSYSIDELGGTWCHAEANNVDQYGNIMVYDDQVTYVTIFNCGPRETPKTPTPKGPKFPNTGVGPQAAQFGA
jgi:hypothetical protein